MAEQRIVSLDALRGLAAFAVAIPHFVMAMDTEYGMAAESVAALAVEVFFMLSGFVLAPQILYCLEKNSLSRLEVFLARRWMRTLPPFLLALIITAIITGQGSSPETLKYTFFMMNFLIPPPHNDYFPVAWSLAIEEWFYLFFPAFLILSKLLRIRMRTSVPLFILIFVASKLSGLFYAGAWDVDMRRVTVYRLDAIAFGFCLSCLIQATDSPLSHKIQKMFRPRANLFLLFSAISAGAATYCYISLSGITTTFLFLYGSAISAAILLLYFFVKNEFFSTNKIACAISEYSGALSYSVYLIHYPILLIVRNSMPSAPPLLSFAVFMVVTIATAIFIRRMYEEPILNLRPRYEGRS